MVGARRVRLPVAHPLEVGRAPDPGGEMTHNRSFRGFRPSTSGEHPVGRLVVATTFLVAFIAACAPPESDAPDLIFTRGVIYPLGPTDTPVSALAVKGGEISATGTDTEIRSLAGPRTQQMDLQGEVAFPGFHDLWVDPEALGRWDEHPLDLRLASSREEIQAILRNAAAARPEAGWLVGWGWEESAWPDPSLPSRATLDAVTERPVVLYRRVGRIAWANTAGLQEAGINAQTPDVDDGRIVRGPDGEPTGLLEGRAIALIENAVPGPDDSRRREWITAGLQRLAAAGFTSVTTPPVDAATARLYADLARRELLSVRVHLRWEPADVGAVELPDRDLLDADSVGLDVDGPFGPRLAALSEPYADAPDTSGLLVADRDAVEAAADAAATAGLRLDLQSRGDRAVRLALDVLRSGDMLVGMDLPPEDAVPALTGTGVGVAIAPSRFAHDVYWLEERLGLERAGGAHPWRALVAAGIPWRMASIAPSHGLSPLSMVMATARRTDADGYPAGGWHPEHAVGRAFALRALAASPVDGSGLAAGAPADLVVWSEDLLQVDDETLLRAQPLVTLVGGRVAFSRALVDLPMAEGR